MSKRLFKNQPTGLKDKNGRMIHEGDKTKEWLLDSVLEEGGFWNYGTVKFYKGCFCWYEKGYDYSRKGADEPMFLFEVAKDVEVI